MKKRFKYSKLKSLFKFKTNFKKPAPSGFILKFGDRGVGKSTDIAKFFYKEYKKYLKGKCRYKGFYTNLYIPNADPEFYHYLELGKYKFSDYIDPGLNDEYIVSTYYKAKNVPGFTIGRNSFICIDELGIISNSRDFKNFPLEWTYFCKFIRHYGCYMVCYSQAYDVDKSLRTAANQLFLMRKFKNMTISFKLIKRIVVDQDRLGASDEQIHDQVKEGSLLNPFNYRFTYIPFYTSLFDSFR